MLDESCSTKRLSRLILCAPLAESSRSNAVPLRIKFFIQPHHPNSQTGFRPCPGCSIFSRTAALAAGAEVNAAEKVGALLLTALEDLLVILVCTSASLLLLWLLQRIWPYSERRNHNDIIGWQVSVLGTTYAVIVGFMLYAVWTTFQSAEINAENEANCLVNVYRIADGLPAAQRVQVQQLAREYANTVINQEWPAMHRGEATFSARATIEKLYTVVMQARPATFAEQSSMSLTLTEIASMTEHRRVRELESQSKLPSILWIVLFLGGVITSVSACLFGTENFKLHALQVFSLTLLLSLALVAIGDIDRPFQGTVRVLPRGFERARTTFAEPHVIPQ